MKYEYVYTSEWDEVIRLGKEGYRLAHTETEITHYGDEDQFTQTNNGYIMERTEDDVAVSALRKEIERMDGLSKIIGKRFDQLNDAYEREKEKQAGARLGIGDEDCHAIDTDSMAWLEDLFPDSELKPAANQ